MRDFISCGLLLFLFFSQGSCSFLVRGFKEPEVDMDVTAVIKHYGYPLESHEVTTDDGYILSLQRIPYGVKNTQTPRPVVFLQHGLLDSSFTWVNNGPEKSLAFLLADNGFDVWLCNSRGNLYSKKHIIYKTNSKKFWDFTWDEMATYDLPAAINYALSVSKAEKLGYIGHSQGTEIGFAQFSKNTDLNSKVSAFVALAPVAYLGHLKTALRHLAGLGGIMNMAAQVISKGEFLPNTEILTRITQVACGIKIGSKVCGNIAFLLQGPNVENLNTSRMPIYMSHLPAGTSSKNMNHYGQSYLSNKFQYYDYGFFGNLRHYRNRRPPVYKLNTNGLPIAMFWGGNDWLAVPKDVERTIRELGDNVKLKRYIPEYNHLDFIWGIDLVDRIFPDILKFLKTYN